MTEQVIQYIIFWWIAVLALFSFVIGSEKMIKIILGNYVLSLVCLAASQSLDILISFFQATPAIKIAGLSYGDLAKFLVGGHVGIIIFLYVALLLLIYHKSTIRIKLPEDDIVQKSLYLLLVPLTILSMIFTFQIVVMGGGVFNPAYLDAFALSFWKNTPLYQIIVLTPVWMCLHGIFTIILSSEVKITLKTDIE